MSEGAGREVLIRPYAPGGQIVLADIAGRTAGCVALLPMPDGAYEVAKMAVAPALHGHGAGRAAALSGEQRLAPALRLYESAGFRHLPPHARPISPYARTDVFMEMLLEE